MNQRPQTKGTNPETEKHLQSGFDSTVNTDLHENGAGSPDNRCQ